MRMRRPTHSVEIVEVLHPDDPDSPWEEGADAAAPTPREAPTRRSGRVMAVAGVAVALAVVAAAFIGRDGSSATSTSTAALTTVPVVDPADAAPSGFYAVVDPSLTPFAADPAQPLTRSGVFRIWAARGPEGVWIAAEGTARKSLPHLFPDGRRRTVDGFELITPTDQPTRTLVEVSNDSWSATITAHLVDDATLVRFVDGLIFGRGDLLDGARVLRDLGLTDAAHYRRGTEAMYGETSATVRYLTADGKVVVLRMAAGADLSEHSAMLSYFTDGPVSVDIVGRVSGRLADTGESVFMWAADGQLFTLTGPLPVADLEQISRHVAAMSNSEWAVLTDL